MDQSKWILQVSLPLSGTTIEVSGREVISKGFGDRS